MPDDGISPAYGHTFSGDAQITGSLGEGFSGAAANDSTNHYYDAPSSGATPITLTAGTLTTDVWKRRYVGRSKTPSYRLVFHKGQTITSADITVANTANLQGTV